MTELVVRVPGKPFSLNAERSKHWSDRASRTAQVRGDAHLAALAVWATPRRKPLFDKVSIIVEPWSKDRRGRQDIGACLPTTKAAIDGLVDAGVILDDNDNHLIALTFKPHQFGRDELVLTVRGEL